MHILNKRTVSALQYDRTILIIELAETMSLGIGKLLRQILSERSLQYTYWRKGTELFKQHLACLCGYVLCKGKFAF